MDPTINKILTNNQVDGRIFTHGSMGTVKGSYQLNNRVREEFFELYTQAVLNDDQDVIEAGIGETTKIHSAIPVLVDLDIKMKEEDAREIMDGDDKLYTYKQVEQVITVYQVVLKKILNNCKDSDLTCVLLEKPAYVEIKNTNKYLKNGFHLHFPGIFMNKKDQKNHLIPRVKEEFKNRGIFDNLFEDSSSVIDAGYLSSTWLLYGSSKGEGKQPYRITKVFDADCEEITLDEAFRKYQIFDCHEKLIKIQGNIEKYLPRILSIIPHNRIPKELKTNIISPMKQKLVEERRKVHASIDAKKAAEIAKDLMPMISSTRADDHNDWMTIGWALYNATEGSDDGFHLWNTFTQTAEEPRGEERCVYEWGIMKRHTYTYTLGTLHYFASQDSPERYKEYKTRQSSKYMEEAIDGSHNDIAKMLKSEYASEFVCASIDSKTWFRFQDNTWEQMEGGVFLRKKISDELAERFHELNNNIWAKVMAAHEKADEGEKAKWDKRLKQVQTLRKNLKSAPFKNNVMRECADEFYDAQFKEKLDTNPYLIAFKNGVYDLEKNIFRKGRPEDFLSKEMNVNYKEYDEEDEEVQEVVYFLQKIFPDKSLYRYFMDLASDVFVGGNHQKKVYFWLGAGDNGKSVLQKLMELMLGKLAIKFDTSLITGKKPGQGSAHAELARAGGGVRWATLDEPNKDEQINSGVMKKLSGNDSYFARDLFEKGKDTREIHPLFKLIFICLSGDTNITMSNGTSLSIQKLIKNDSNVLSWCGDGFTSMKMSDWIEKGEQDCVTLTLEDGSSITCTPNHRFLTSQGEWVDAKDIQLGVTSLNSGITGVNCDDVLEDYNYSFGNFDLTKLSDRMKVSAFSRLLGYMVTDGTMNRTLYIGHKVDTVPILDDIELLTCKRPCIVNNNHVLQITVPLELTRLFNSLVPVQKGGRINNKSILPQFIYDDDCPNFILREFIASMFGGDGIVPCLVKNQFTMLQLVGSKIEYHVNSLIENMNRLKDILYTRFGIESYVRTQQYEEDKHHVFLSITKNTSILDFINKIGIRYCHHKIYRCLAVSKAMQYQKNVIEQNNWIINRTKQLLNMYKRQNIPDKIIQYSLTGEFLNEFDSTQKAQHNTGIDHTLIRQACLRNIKGGKGVSKGYIWKFKPQKSEILTESGCKYIHEAYNKAIADFKNRSLFWCDKNVIKTTQLNHYNNKFRQPSIDIQSFLDRTGLSMFCNQYNGKGNVNYSIDKNSSLLPSYKLRVVGRVNSGVKSVYDISVDDYHNFIANGITSHNCNKLPHIKYSDKATWNRIRVLLFESTFIDPNDPELPKTFEEQLLEKKFPKDLDLEKKLPAMAEPFAWLLLQHRMKVTSRTEPEKVMLATNMYRRQTDIYRQFIEESIVEDSDKILTLTSLYATFIDWFRQCYPGQSVHPRPDVQDYFETIWGTCEAGKKWSGYRLRTTKDDIKEGKVIVLGEDVDNNENEDEEDAVENGLPFMG